MSILFEAAFAFVAGVEGVYSDDPRDRGNWTTGRVGVGELRGTKYGISAAAFPHLDIANVTLDQAKALYLVHYWTPVRADAFSLPVATACFDQAVNQGVHSAIITLQQSVGVAADGWIGPITIAAVEKCPAQDLLLEICARRALAYALSAEIATDGLGWMRRLFKLSSQFQKSKDSL